MLIILDVSGLQYEQMDLMCRQVVGLFRPSIAFPSIFSDCIRLLAAKELRNATAHEVDLLIYAQIGPVRQFEN